MIKKSLAYFQCSNVLTGQCKDEVTSYSPLILVNLIVGSSNRNTNYSSILYKICSFFGLVVSTRRIYATWSPRPWFICDVSCNVFPASSPLFSSQGSPFAVLHRYLFLLPPALVALTLISKIALLLHPLLFIYLATSSLSCSVQDLHCITWDLVHVRMDSSVVQWLSSCGRLAQLLFAMWDLSSLTRDWIHIPLYFQVDSLPLGHQGSPSISLCR